MQFVQDDTSSYDFQVYYRAAQDFGTGRDPYYHALHCCQGIFDTPGGYTYPPLLAELMRPLAALPIREATRAWLALNYALLAASIYMTWRLVGAWISPTAKATLLTATLLFKPLQVTIDLRQINLLLVFLLTVAVVSYARRRGAVAAGIAIAVGGVVKLLPALLAVALVRRQGRLRLLPGFMAFVATSVVLLGALLLITPFTADYFLRVLPRLTQGSAVYLNQSLLGVSLRLQFLLFHGVQPVVHVLTSLAVLALVALTWWRGRALDGPRGRTVVFASLLALVPVVSSITWDHHLVSELLVFALAAPVLAPWSGRWWLAVVAYPLLWLPHSVWIVGLNGLGAPLPLIVLLGGSLPAIGTLMLWLACYLGLSRTPSEAVPPVPGWARV